MEFLNLTLIFTAAVLVLRAPGRERLAFRLLVASSVLMVWWPVSPGRRVWPSRVATPTSSTRPGW